MKNQLRLVMAGLLITAVSGLENATFAQEENPAAFPKLEFRRWSGPINVPDPVALSVDPQGRVFVTQTRRRKIQDLDIREHKEWIPDDVGLTSVEEKRRFFKQQLAVGGDDGRQSRQVEDLNEDGVHDWRDLTVISECIYRLVDSDDDGTADEISVFAENFQTEVTGVAAGVLAFDGDVYATIAPDVWKLRDHDADGVADTRSVVAHGFGLHIGYGGHDMHGLTVGPDGKIYWSIGDKGVNVTTADGRNYRYPNQGAVMRCNPDGSDFEVFAHGLRNLQEPEFDQYGNLFGVDNDADKTGERERLVYVVDQMDAGWRCNYQYRGDAYDPWMEEGLWDLPGPNHAAYIIPPIQHYIDGPAGFKFNPGTALSEDYKNFFFLTGAPNGDQFAFRLEPNGDSFKMVDSHRIGSGIAIVGLAFGPDGALYGADWDGGYPLDEKGAVIRIDVPGAKVSPARQEVRELLGQGFAGHALPELKQMLGHADRRVRLGGQFELVSRNATSLLQTEATDVQGKVLARLHAIWGLGQLARAGVLHARDTLPRLFADTDYHIRGQAAKTYGEIAGGDGELLCPLLSDNEPYVRSLAGLALARRPTPAAIEILLSQAVKLGSQQHYVRHSLFMALSRCATTEQLATLAASESEMQRMCAVLALRRQGSSHVTAFLQDPSSWVATEAARAIHDDDSIPSALLQLAATITSGSDRRRAYWMRSINANFRLGDAESGERMLTFARDQKQDVEARLEALDALSAWMNPPLLDRVEGVRRELPSDRRRIHMDHAAASLTILAASSSKPIRTAAVAAARKLGVRLGADVLRDLVRDETNDVTTRVEALAALGEAGDAQLRELCQASLSSEEASLQQTSIELLCIHYPALGLSEIGRLLQEDSPIQLKQFCIALLPKLPGSAGKVVLQRLAERLAEGELDERLSLDVYEAASAMEGAIDVPPISSKYGYSKYGGDAKLGERLFRTHVQAQCVRCHRIGQRGSTIGPELTRIASKRDADYLLRAIAAPSADIEPEFLSQTFLLESGEIVQGVVQRASDDEIVVADAAGNLITVSPEKIEDTSKQRVSLMPEMTNILSAREVRDLVAYLRTLH